MMANEQLLDPSRSPAPHSASYIAGTKVCSQFISAPAVIQEATVTALDESRGVVQEAVAIDSGGFVFSHLAPGMYTLRFEAPNFTPLTVRDSKCAWARFRRFRPNLR